MALSEKVRAKIYVKSVRLFVEKKIVGRVAKSYKFDVHTGHECSRWFWFPIRIQQKQRVTLKANIIPRPDFRKLWGIAGEFKNYSLRIEYAINDARVKHFLKRQIFRIKEGIVTEVAANSDKTYDIVIEGEFNGVTSR